MKKPVIRRTPNGTFYTNVPTIDPKEIKKVRVRIIKELRAAGIFLDSSRLNSIEEGNPNPLVRFLEGIGIKQRKGPKLFTISTSRPIPKKILNNTVGKGVRR